MRKILVLMLMCAVFAGGTAFSAQIADLSLPQTGEYYYWYTYKDVSGKQTTTTPRLVKDKKSKIDLPLVKDALPPSTLYMLNTKTGNEAIIPVKPKLGIITFSLTSGDFDRVRRVDVKVVSSEKQLPAAAAVVSVQDSLGNVQTQVLDPSSQGVIRFGDLAAGKAKFSVEYGDGQSSINDIEIPLERKESVAFIGLPIAGDIETVKSAEASHEKGQTADGKGSSDAERAKSAEGFDPITAFVGLIIIAGIIYLAFVMLRNRGATAKQLLQKAGIDIPEDPVAAPAAPAPVQTDPGVCPFCGGRKDPTTGSCSCSLGTSSAAPSMSTGPRLVAMQGTYAGNIYPLNQGTVSLGREESNNVAFPQDSTSSRRHASITNAGGQFTIKDEGSSNGTFVNGVKISEVVLHPGDEIQVGSTRLRFEA